MYRQFLLVLLVLSLVVVAGSARADDEESPGLTIGDVAPALDIAYWVKGVEMDRRGNFEPVKEFETGTIYVIEFWATWCGPCRAGMPHLSELQEQYAGQGVRIISISDESLPKVYEFLWKTDRDGALQNDRTRYTLTTDPDRSTHKNYMEAAGQTGIPTAFVVGKAGVIEWIGHPSRLDDVLEALVADTWDRDAFKETFEVEQRVKRAMAAARPRLAAAVQEKDGEALLAIFDELLELAPDNARLRMQKLNAMLAYVDDKARVYAYAEELAKGIWDDAQQLNAVAWNILDGKDVLHRDFDFALRLAERGVEVSEAQDAAILDTLARAHFEKGDLEKAIEWQTKAAWIAPEGPMKEGIEATLEKYRQAKGE